MRAPDGTLNGPARVEPETHPQLEGAAVLLRAVCLCVCVVLCVTHENDCVSVCGGNVDARTWRSRGSVHIARRRLSRWRATRSLRQPMSDLSARASTPGSVEVCWVELLNWDGRESRMHAPLTQAHTWDAPHVEMRQVAPAAHAAAGGGG